MKKSINRMGRKMVASNKGKRTWQRFLRGISGVVVFVTTYALILPAITMTPDPICGFAEHTHTAECSTLEMTCGVDTSNIHVHDSECYGTEVYLSCTEPETEPQSVLICSEEHEHSDSCWTAVGGHTHSSDCYGSRESLTCTLSTEPHTHSDDCFSMVLTCGLNEHVHDNSCYPTNETTAETTEQETEPEQTEETTEVTEETQETEEPADTEEEEEEETEATEETEPFVPGADDDSFLSRLPGQGIDWTANFLNTAYSQLGYSESVWEAEDGSVRRYSMYGKAYGNESADWDAIFASWCLLKAGVPDAPTSTVPAYFPRSTSTSAWQGALNGAGLFHAGKNNWEPKSGDLVFFTAANGRMYVGILTGSYRNQSSGELSDLLLIIGDWKGSVSHEQIPLHSVTLSGWARLPENPFRHEIIEEEEEVVAVNPFEEIQETDVEAAPSVDTNPDDEDIAAAVIPGYVLDLMQWTDRIGAIAYSDGTVRAGSLREDMEDDGIVYAASTPLPLGDTANYGSGAGYITSRTIYWHDPASSDPAWVEFKASENPKIPANAEFRMLVKFVGVDSNLLKNHGYQLTYNAEDILTNFSATGVIRNEGGAVVGQITAKSAEGHNKVSLDFSMGSSWVNEQDVIESEFYYQGQLNLKDLEDKGDGIINLAGIDIQIPDASDAIAEFASVELAKESSGLQKDADGKYYIEYTLTVTAGEYGSPNVRLLDTVVAQGKASYINGYIGVTGSEQTASGPAAERPLDSSGSPGSVYLTNTTKEQIKDKTAANPVPAAGGNHMAWIIGDMGPNETRTLTYRVAVDDSYIGLAHQSENIVNTADLFSKNYERGTKVKTTSPTATANISKAKTEGTEPRISSDGTKYLIDYTIVVTADKRNSYPMTDVKVYDFANQYEGTEYADYIRLVEGSMKLDGSAEELNNYTTYRDAAGNLQTRDNPKINSSHSNRFDVFVGDLEPGQSRKITYTLELDIAEAQRLGNGALGIFNRAYVFSDEVRQNMELNSAGTRDIFSYNQWVQKTKGAQTATSVTTNFPAGAKIFDATQHTPVDQMLPTVGGVSSYTIPAGSYAYTVKVNQNGEWDVSSATMRDTLQASDSNGNVYMQFVEYVRVDVYDKLIDGETGEAVQGPTLKESIWVKIDDQWQFAFTGKQIGLDGSDAYVLTYYTEAILPPGVSSYGTINADNKFGLSGTVGKGGVFLNVNISQKVTVSAKEPGVNDPVKVAWYYDAKDTTFNKYHTDNKGNGSLYWIIKISGNKIPKNMQFQESTRLGGWDNYLRNSESLLGFFLVKFDEGTENASNADEFLARYETFQDFADDLASDSGNIRAVPETFNGSPLYTQKWSGYTDNRHGNNGQHFDLTLKFEQDYTITSGEALYLLVKTDPVKMPDPGTVRTYSNKCNFRTDAMGNLTNWPTTQATQKIIGPDGSLNKYNSGVYTAKNGVFTKLDPSYPNVFTDVALDRDDFASTSAGNMAGKFKDGTYVMWTLNVDRALQMRGSFDIYDTLPEGVELVYVRPSTAYTSFNRPNGYPYYWGPDIKNYAQLQAATSDIGAQYWGRTWAWSITGENGLDGAGWTKHICASRCTNATDSRNATAAVYYTKGNQIAIHLPEMRGTQFDFQVLCRLTPEAESELTFGDVLLNNQATLVDERGNPVESTGAEIRVKGGNVNKELLTSGKYNNDDPEKLNSTVYPYRIAINAERVDMSKDSDVITLPLHDRMTGNMSVEMSSLCIYALPAGVTAENDSHLIYYGGSYTNSNKALGRPWYTTNTSLIGKPLGYIGGGTPIRVYTRDAGGIIGPDGSPMQEVIFENLPDETSLVITYSVSVRLLNGTNLVFENKAFWENYEENEGGESESINKEYKADGLATGSEHGAVHIVKYDSEDYLTRLAGAEFELYRAEYKLATEGNAYVVGSDAPLSQGSINANHWNAVYEGTNYSKNSTDPEIPVRRDSSGNLVEVYLPDSFGQPKWMSLSDAKGLGYNLHHKFDLDASGNLKLCVVGPLAYGETDENGNLSYGFGDGNDFGERFIWSGGVKQYLSKTDYAADRIHFNKVYAVKESKAPEGYELDSTAHFFVVPNATYDGVGLNYFYHDIWPDEVHICTKSMNGEITYMLEAANVKKKLSVSKDFAGSLGVARPGTYTFGLWSEPLTTSTMDGVAATVSITYTAEDFSTSVDANGNTVYTLLPDHIKTEYFPISVNFGTYYIYELNSSGKPILTSGNVNGFTYTPEFSGAAAGTAPNQIVFNSTNNSILATNRGYSVDVVKNFRDLGGNVLAHGLQGTYNFGIWPADALAANGLPDAGRSPLDVKTLTWERGDTQQTKSAKFSGLRSDTDYVIFELDDSFRPIAGHAVVNMQSGNFVVTYSAASVRPADGTAEQITVSNSAYVSLPKTGGMGTEPITYSGIALVSFACFGYIFCLLLRRRREGECS